MRPFLLLTSLLALALGFAGTALGVRPRPVVAGSSTTVERTQELEMRVRVLTEALEDLEERFADHQARMPARPAVSREAEPGSEAEALADEAPEAPLLLAALERAEDRVLAGDARGARDLFREILARDDLPEGLRLRARLGVVDTWEILGAWDRAREELEGVLAGIPDTVGTAEIRREVGDRLARIVRESAGTDPVSPR